MSTSQPTCANCENPVSHDYQRVFGTNDGTVTSCPECHWADPIGEHPVQRARRTAAADDHPHEPQTPQIDTDRLTGVSTAPPEHDTPAITMKQRSSSSSNSNSNSSLNPAPIALRCTVCGWPSRDGLERMRDHLLDHGIETDPWEHIEQSDDPTTPHRVLF